MNDGNATMKTRNCLNIAILSFCTVLASWADAQERADGEEFFPLVVPDGQSEGLSTKLRGSSDFSNIGKKWVADLEQAGFVNRSLRGPYRVAVPLVSFGHAGPRLMLTYARKLPGSSDGGVLIFMHIPLQ